MVESRRARGSTQDDVRRHNLGAILTEVHRHGRRSRAELTAEMGLNRSTIGDLVAELTTAGLVLERSSGATGGVEHDAPGSAGRGIAGSAGHGAAGVAGQGAAGVAGQGAAGAPPSARSDDTVSPSGRVPGPLGPEVLERPRRAGRPSLEVVPCAEGVYVLAVDLGVRHLVVARVGLGGTLLERVAVRTEQPLSVLDVTVDAIARTSERLRSAAPSDSRCVGIGLSVPGVVRQEDGLLRFAPNLGWIDLPLGARLGEHLDLPVVIANDVDLGALAEHWRGVAAGYENVIVISGEIGIGGGILVGGKPLRGRRGYAGEIGHLRVNPDGRQCRCGLWGCLETEIDIAALLRAAGRPAGGGLDAYRSVLAAASSGDPAALEASAGVARWLGIGVGMLVNIFNPDIVVLGGALGEFFAVTERWVTEEFARSSLVAPREDVRLAASALGTDAQIVGAAELAFAPLLDDPIGGLARLGA